MSLLVYGGSLQFVMVPLLLGTFQPLAAFLLALMIQARHLFYGISMLDKYKDLGWKRYYLIFSLCDETFSVNYASEPPKGVDPGWFYFFISLLNQLYWVTASSLGALLGALISMEAEGLSFVLTALFLVILLDQWRKEKRHWSVAIGFLSSLACLLLLGPDSFLLPAMTLILLVLSLFRRRLEEGGKP